ncbi:YhjD/YihY/BrkB family envelope integrity protein [[Mycoplasma] collis]|uniref:YhjD/YihY/BrkB family envelope integrity protein n=1 Tax=[Mycoplasma] collis TaxID=2127 RepID=UPI00068F331C|nr:YhjD/YihY/BrkB family envelope integrity protein [[Mycoplasma] collis]
MPNNWYKNRIITKKKRNIWQKILTFLVIIPLRIAVTPKWWKKNNIQTKVLIQRSVKKISSHEFIFIPSGFAFYSFISFIPILALSLSTINLLNIEKLFNNFFDNSIEDYISSQIISRYIPGIDKVIQTLPKQWNLIDTDEITFLILFFSSLWISSSGYAKFITSQSIIYDHKNLGNWFINRLKGFVIVVFISIFLSFLLITAAFVFKSLENIYSSNSVIYILFFYFISSFYILLFFYFIWLFLLKYTPTFKTKIKEIYPGVILSSLATVLFTTIFGYVSSIKIIDYRKFGVFATFLYLAPFNFFLSYILYFGIIINEAFYKSFISSKTKNKYKYQNKKF